MIKKKIQTISIACFMLLAAIALVPNTAVATSPVSVWGHVFDEADSGNQIIPDEVKVLLSDGQEIIADIDSVSGIYVADFNANQGDTGIFYVTITEGTWQAAETLTVVAGQIPYEINLTINTSEDPISDVDTEAPSKVTGLTVSDAKDGKLNLEWDAATDNVAVNYYNIYRDGTFLTTTTGTTYQDTGLNNGQEYCYNVSAVDTSNNEGELSDQACGTPTKTSTPSPPPGPGPSPGDDDDDDYTPTGDDDDDTEVIPNTPPEVLEFDGDPTGSIDEELSYYAIAKAPEEDQKVNFTFYWDDETTNITEYVDNNSRYNITHTWTAAGIYDIWVKSWDDYTNETNGVQSTNTLTLQVLIDAHIIVADCVDGYLTDDDSDGIYDKFHNDDGSVTDVEQEDGSYKLHADDDGEFDYLYNPDTGDCEVIEEPEPPAATQEDNYTMYYIAGILIILAILILFFLATRKKSKKEK